MSLFDRLLGRKAAPALDYLSLFSAWSQAKSGQVVNYQTALQVTAVLACCKVIAEGIAQVPCRLRAPRPDGGTDNATDHPLFALLDLEPMAGQSAFELWETIVLHVALAEAAYVFKSRNARGELIELILLEPGKVEPSRLPDRSMRYAVTGDDGRRQVLTSEDIWHVRGLSWNGWRALPAVRLAREAIGLSLALEESHARVHENGVQPSGLYSVEGKLGEAQYKQLAAWLKAHAAGDNRGSPLILDNGAKWLQQQMTGVDAQHLETRRFQVEEICRAFRVMPIMIGASDKSATYASAEQMFLAHVVHCLSPWATRLEKSASVALLTPQEKRQGLRVKFMLQALMRGDYKSRQEGLQIMRRNGVINADEWRVLEDMNPRGDAGGGQYIVEANMAVQDGRDLVPSRPPAAASA